MSEAHSLTTSIGRLCPKVLRRGCGRNVDDPLSIGSEDGNATFLVKGKALLRLVRQIIGVAIRAAIHHGEDDAFPIR